MFMFTQAQNKKRHKCVHFVSVQIILTRAHEIQFLRCRNSILRKFDLVIVLSLKYIESMLRCILILILQLINKPLHFLFWRFRLIDSYTMPKIKRGSYFNYLSNVGNASHAQIPRQTLWNRRKNFKVLPSIQMSMAFPIVVPFNALSCA